MKILLNGYKGRMGQAISAAAQAAGAEIVAKCDIGETFTAEAVASCDVAIDFSFHEVTPALAEACAVTLMVVTGPPIAVILSLPVNSSPKERSTVPASFTE